MLRWIATITLVLTTADHWTTYLCLRKPIHGFEVIEANPVADWLFGSVGLIPGLLFDTTITLLALAFLVFTTQLSEIVKYGFLTLTCCATSFAVANNLQAMSAMGISLLDWS
jgi:hypothetical protein